MLERALQQGTIFIQEAARMESLPTATLMSLGWVVPQLSLQDDCARQWDGSS